MIAEPPAKTTEKQVAEVELPKSTKGQKLVISNQLVDANYRLTLTQMRLVYMFGTLIQAQEKEFRFYRVKIKDVLRLLRLGTNYALLEDAIDGIVGKTVHIPKGGKGEKRRWLKVTWAASADYKGDEGIIEFEFSDKMKPFLLDLKQEFTMAELEEILSLRSSYLVKFFVWLKKNLGLGIVTVRVTELRRIVGADLVNSKGDIVDRVYPRYANLKQHILEKGREKIPQNTSIGFTYKELKEQGSRSVTHLTFSIVHKGNPAERLPLQGSGEVPAIVTAILEFDPSFIRGSAQKISELEWEFVDWESDNLNDRETLEAMREEEGSFLRYVREKIYLAKQGGKGAGFLTRAIQYNWTNTKQKQDRKQEAGRRKQKERSADEEAARKGQELRRIEAKKKADEYDQRFSELSMFAQEEIRSRATEMFRKDASDFEKGRYEKEKAEGKTIDDMSVLVAVTYRKYRNQLMDSPEFAELDSEVNA